MLAQADSDTLVWGGLAPREAEAVALPRSVVGGSGDAMSL